MNSVNISGNITKDPELKETQSGKGYVTFSVACRRNYKNEEGGYDADFINCVAWGPKAEFICKYFKKGNRIEVGGRLSTRSYDDKEGNKKYVTEVIVDNAEFGGGSKGDNKSKNEDTFVPPGFTQTELDGELPF